MERLNLQNPLMRAMTTLEILVSYAHSDQLPTLDDGEAGRD